MGCVGGKQNTVDDTHHDYLFKLVMVGESGVGKSSLILRYCDDTFVDEDVHTIGADFKVKYITVDKKRIKLQIWDTAGQERFRIMTSSYFGGANAVIVAFDLTNKNSFDQISKWIKEAQSFAGQQNGRKLEFLVIGNKSDLKERAVGKDEPRQLAEKLGALYQETSAKTGAKVTEAFYSIGEKLRNDADGIFDE